MKRILVIAAHPDDETYGVGGTICRHVDHGDDVKVLILADGVTARHNAIDQQQAAAIEAAKALGVSEIIFAGLPDQRLDSLPLLDLIKPISELLNNYKPDTVYTHHSGDTNQDHRAVFQATLVACRPMETSPVQNLICYEVASSTEWSPATPGWQFMPNHYVNIELYLSKKILALGSYTRTYVSEVPAFPHPRSIESTEFIARERGVRVGFKAAEAFMIIRQLV